MTRSITWRRWRGTSCGRGLRKKSLDSNQRKSASTLPRRRAGRGSPYYILPAKIPELTRPEDAVLVEAELSRGGDIVKLFTGSWATPSAIVVMPVEVVRAAVEVGHRRRKLVFPHPSNRPGARAVRGMRAQIGRAHV